MRKYIVIFILFVCCIRVNIHANTFQKEVALAKDYSLAYCLYNFHQTTPSSDIAVAQSMYFQSMIIGHDTYTKINNYIKSYMSSNYIFDVNIDNPKENEPVYFIMCLEMYNSKEFHTKIEKILKETF